MNKIHRVESITLSGTVMFLRVDGGDYKIDIAKHSKRLANASQNQIKNFEVSPSGYGIHWPDLDEDLSIDGDSLLSFSSGTLNIHANNTLSAVTVGLEPLESISNVYIGAKLLPSTNYTIENNAISLGPTILGGNF